MNHIAKEYIVEKLCERQIWHDHLFNFNESKIQCFW